MKGKIQQLLFQDEGRLPLLALVPKRGTVQDLPKLRAALEARLEKVGEKGSSEGSSSVVVTEGVESERSEREMLKTALEWIRLQDEET